VQFNGFTYERVSHIRLSVMVVIVDVPGIGDTARADPR